MSHLDPRTAQCDKEVQRITHLQKIANQLPDAFTDTTKVTKSYISAANTPTKEERREIIWNASSMSHLDPRTIQCDKEVQRITHLQKIASQLADAFTDTTKVTKSYISAANTPAKEERREIIWNASSMSHLDPHTIQCDKEVQRITHLQKIASQLPDAFTDTTKVTKSYISAANTPTKEERREIIWNASSMSHLDPRTIQCDKEVQRITHLQKIASQLPDAFQIQLK